MIRDDAIVTVVVKESGSTNGKKTLRRDPERYSRRDIGFRLKYEGFRAQRGQCPTSSGELIDDVVHGKNMPSTLGA